LPEPKSSSAIEDDRIDKPIVQDLNGSPSLQINVSDEGYPKSLKEAIGHPIEQVIEVMAEIKTEMTMEEFVTKDRSDNYSGITRITVNGKHACELKGKFLDDLRDNAFCGTNEEDANGNNDDKQEIFEVFRTETNIFDYDTSLCKAFYEFNYLLQIDPDVLTKDIDGFKTYDKYKDDWIYEWNNDIRWVHEKPWTDDEVWEEPTHIVHYCEPFLFKSGHSEWPTCSWKDNGYCNGGNLPGGFRVAIMERVIDIDEESCDEAWRRWDDYENTIHNDEEKEPKDDHSIDNLDYDLVRDNTSNHTNDKVEEHKERCNLFDDTAHDASVCKIRRF
ncbi:hypothetical protein Tco_0272817, partial [Tanacetum coccineum]